MLFVIAVSLFILWRFAGNMSWVWYWWGQDRRSWQYVNTNRNNLSCEPEVSACSKWTEGRTDGRMDKRTNEQPPKNQGKEWRLKERRNKRTNDRTNGWINHRPNDRVAGRPTDRPAGPSDLTSKRTNDRTTDQPSDWKDGWTDEQKSKRSIDWSKERKNELLWSVKVFNLGN